MKSITTPTKKALVLSLMLGLVFSTVNAGGPKKPQQWNFFWMKLTSIGKAKKAEIPQSFSKRLKNAGFKSEVVSITLNRKDSELSACLIDSKTGRPHMLSGTISGNSVAMNETDEQGVVISKLQGNLHSANNFEGTWVDMRTNNANKVKMREPMNEKIQFTTEHLRKRNCALITMNSGSEGFGGECSSIDIELLKVNSVDPELNRKINKLIEASICNSGENKTTSLDDYMSNMIRMGDKEQFTYKIKCELVSLNKNILSICIETKMNAGKDNEYINRSYVNYDLRTCSPLRLQDLMVRFYSSKLNPMAEQQFTKNYWKKGWGFEQHKFKLPANFAVTSAGLYFEYNPYEIRQDIEGAPQVFIPYKQIIDIINPLSPLAMMLQK